MKLSIITVTYNCEIKLQKTIDSVLSQGTKDYEYIVVDGASSDGTIDIIKKYQDNLTYWISEPDEGLYYAMNKALKVANGEYVYFLNAGDYLKPGILSRVIEYLNIDNPDVLYGNIENEKYGICYPLPLDAIHWQMPLGHPAVFIKKDIHGYFDTRYRIAADYKKIYELYNRGLKFIYIPYTVSFFEAGGISDNPLERCIERTSIACQMFQHKDTSNMLYKKILLDFYEKEQFELMLSGFDDTIFIDQFIETYFKEYKDVIFWGTGDIASRSKRIFEVIDKKIKYFVDSNEKKWNLEFRNYKISNPQQLLQEKDICIFILNEKNCSAITAQIEQMQLDLSNKILNYLDFRKSFCEEFNSQLVEKGSKEIQGFRELFN